MHGLHSKKLGILGYSIVLLVNIINDNHNILRDIVQGHNQRESVELYLNLPSELPVLLYKIQDVIRVNIPSFYM